MAIRFVDKAPEGDGPDGTKPARMPRVQSEAALPVSETVADGAGLAEAEATLPRLTHAKPEPKPRGRKVPMAQVAADKAKPVDGAETERADGLLPGLQLHAKPTPKPRGRKKAFG